MATYGRRSFVFPGRVPDLFYNRPAVGEIPARQVRGCGSIQYRAVRLRLNLRFRLVIGTCPDCPWAFSALHWRLAWIVCFFIRNLRWFLVACFAFINEEYLIALVDLIAPCGGTKGQGRRDLRIPPSLSEARLRG